MTEVVLERTFDIDLAREVVREKGIDVSLSDSLFAFHINSRGIDKRTGLEYVMERRAIPRDDVIAIGDSETDVPMFDAAGTSVALGNAPEPVRKRADIAVRRGAGDGVIEAIELLFPDFGGPAV
jgi:hydroxymethylpyrimidine pyrophosphatase-like HAD family hydrolase